MKKYIVISGMIAVLTVAAAGIQFGVRKSPVNTASGFSAALSGFEPGTLVAYRIFKPFQKDQILKGQTAIDAQGQVQIPPASVTKYDNMGLIYDLTIKEKAQKEPLNLVLSLDPKDQKISVRGRGFDQFTPLSVETNSGKLDTKADWAGMFTRPFGTKIDSADSQIFKIAFADSGFLGSFEDQDPRIIKILRAPGGGEFGNGGVNDYSAEHCGGNPAYFWCDSGFMRIFVNIPHGKIIDNYVRAFYWMTHQFTAVMAQQVEIIGTFLDAKFQLETQRDLQALQAEAHRDYHPSDQMCRFGSFIKSIARSEEKAALEKQAINKTLMTAYKGEENASTAEGYATDIESRLRNFRETYCDPNDNNAQLGFMCDHDQNYSSGAVGANDGARVNKDIDFAATLGMPLTIEVDFATAANTPTEEDVIALGRNLYWPQPLEPGLAEKLPKNSAAYLKARQLFAVQNVAHGIFANQVAMKSQSDTGLGINSGGSFMKSLLRDFGLTDNEINDIMGDNPSYYAQMEVLTKKIYQNPDFYTNLYDKPANVKRIGASLDAIKLMQGRDQFEAALRREMLTSLLVEDALSRHTADLNGKIARESSNSR